MKENCPTFSDRIASVGPQTVAPFFRHGFSPIQQLAVTRSPEGGKKFAYKAT